MTPDELQGMLDALAYTHPTHSRAEEFIGKILAAFAQKNDSDWSLGGGI